MERSGYKLTVLVFIIFSGLTLKANFKSDIYQSYIYGDMTKWKQIIDKMNRDKTTISPQTAQSTYILELINYQYGYVAWCLGTEREDEAEKYLDLAEENVEILYKRNFSMSMVNGYKAAFYGYRIGLNNFKAPFYGSKSYKCAENAINLNAKNPFGYIQFANIQFYMPPAFGGSKLQAIKYYKKAELLMEQNQQEIKDDWNYINLLITIANSYVEVKQTENAKLYFEKILKIEPECQWVKKTLYPQLMKKLIN
jgi:tetratricopeptide (TPR) repeat protein